MDSELLTLANQKAKAGDYEEALRLFREAGGAEGAYGEGACLFRLRRMKEAREALNRSLDIDPFLQKARSLMDRTFQSDSESKKTGVVLSTRWQRPKTGGKRSRCVLS